MKLLVKQNTEGTVPGETAAESPSSARGRPVRDGLRGERTPSSSSEAAFPLTAERSMGDQCSGDLNAPECFGIWASRVMLAEKGTMRKGQLAALLPECKKCILLHCPHESNEFTNEARNSTKTINLVYCLFL